MSQILDISLDAYQVSLKSGFLPEEPPLKRLQDPYYFLWEDLVSGLGKLVEDGSIREKIEKLPVLSTNRLQLEPEWRRAYVCLTFLAQGYTWGGQSPKDVLPRAIACPLIEVSEYLQLKPCATFAAFCLWNFSLVSRTSLKKAYDNPHNLSAISSFTGTTDEEWFFNISVAIEAKGGILIPLMLNAIAAVRQNNAQQVRRFLDELRFCLQDILNILEQMYENCAPEIFYNQIRPFLAGTKNVPWLPNGIFYILGDGGEGEWHQYSGGSNAQSSLIQLIDIFLGIYHSNSHDTVPSTVTEGGYAQEMRYYMPGPHRRFLELMASISNIRPYAMSFEACSGIRISYNRAVSMLGVFRDKHIIMVSRYIFAPASRNSVQSQTYRHTQDISKGTGGTDIVPFLKRKRNDTKATVLKNA